ncbi:MAG: hypothetical protein ACYCY1_12560 [Sulfuriferula sp.]
MRLSCPACGASSSLDALIEHGAAREALAAALCLDARLGALMVKYLALFRPAKTGLSMSRVATLLGELLPMIHAAKIERNGTLYAAPRDAWISAVEDILARRDSLTLPLKTHGYLLGIIVNQAGQAAGRAEKANEQKRSGHTPVGVSAAHRPMQPDAPVVRNPEAAAQAIAAAKAIMKGN